MIIQLGIGLDFRLGVRASRFGTRDRVHLGLGWIRVRGV